MTIHIITLSALILAVLLVRAVFRKKVPARLIYALWLVVAVKLCMPFSFFEVELPMLGAVQQIEQTAAQTQGFPEVSKAPEVTVGAPITPVLPQQPIVSQEVVDPPMVPVAPSVPAVPTITEPAPVEPVAPSVDVPEVPPTAEKTPIDWAHIAQIVWFTGSAAMAVWFTATGAFFYQKLRADRRLHTTVGKTKVYVSRGAGAPCLAGLKSAIYLTPAAANAPSQNFVILHEYTHLRHGDHIWSILRTVALIVYWWNPLVWAAAFVSKQDAELACDEAVAAKMDDATRLAYANTILDTVPQKYAHAVGLASAPIKERILMLTKRHKNRVVAAILAVVFTLSAVGCSFIGLKEETEPVDDTPDLPSSITTTQPTDPPAVTTGDSIVNVPDAPQTPVRVLSNEGGLDIRTVTLPLSTADSEYDTFVYNDRYMLYTVYDKERNADGVIEYYYNVCLYIIDALQGEIVGKYALDTQYRIESIAYTDEGCVLYDAEVDERRKYHMNCAFSVAEENGMFTVAPTTIDKFPYVMERFASSRDQYIVYRTIEDEWGHGGIDIKYPDGSVKRIAENTVFDNEIDGNEMGHDEPFYYDPIGFIDDVHIGYTIGGWESMAGYGIYNVATEEKTEEFGVYRAIGTCDGVLYVEERQNFDDGTYAIWKITPDGEKTLLASKDTNTNVFKLPETPYMLFKNCAWCFYAPTDVETNYITELYAPDFSTKMAEIEWSRNSSDYRFNNFMVYENSLTVVVPYVAEETTQSPVRVLSNAGNLQIRPVYIPAEPFAYKIGKYDDKHYLCLTYDRTELDGYKEYAYNNLHLYIIDAQSGTVAAECAIEGSYYLSSMHYTDNGCILYETEEAAFHVVYENGSLTVNKTERPTYPIVSDCPIVSADGAYTVYTTADDLIGAGTVTVRYADGSVKALLRHKNAGDMVDGKTVDMGDVERYHPVGFIDNARFVYSITGYDYAKGYGVYDLQTGENTKYLQALSVAAVYDGKVYLTKQADYETVSWWMCDPDGSDMTMIASVSEEDGVFTLSGDKYNYTYNFKNGVWFFFTEDDTITLYSHDFGQRLAKLEYADSGYLFGNMQVYQNMLTVIVPYIEADTAQSPVRLLSNEGGVEVHTALLPLKNEDMRYCTFAYDERYTIYLTYERLRNEGQDFAEHSEALYIIDALDGSIAAGYTLDVQARPDTVSYTDNGCILYDRENIGGGQYRVNCAFAITENNGIFSVTSTEVEPYPQNEQRFVSSDGKYIAYEMIEDGWGNGGIDIKSPDGSVKRILTNVMLGNTDACKAEDIGDVVAYVPIGFMDAEHLAYRIGGWEWRIGYGIYNVATGEKTEVKGVYRLAGALDGTLLMEEYQSNGDGTTDLYAIQKVTPDGAQTKIASKDAEDGVYVLSDDKYSDFEHSMWCIFDTGNTAGIGYGEETPETLTVAMYSPDLDEKLCEIEYPHSGNAFDNVHVYGNSVTVVVPAVSAETTGAGTMITSLADWNALNYDGAFPADGNCYAFINSLVHFSSENDLLDRYPELNSVKIDHYFIRRETKDDDILYFDFTVVGSGLDTLPVGSYKTIVDPIYGPASKDAYMTVLETDAVGRITATDSASRSVEVFEDWTLCESAWDFGDYGKYGEQVPVIYIVSRYGDRETDMPFADFAAAVKDKLGIQNAEPEAFAARCYTDDNGVLRIQSGLAYRSGSYDIVSVTTAGNADTLVVQYYADINKLIKSVKMAYEIDSEERLLGCELIEDAKYAPFGLEAKYKYSTWQPME